MKKPRMFQEPSPHDDGTTDLYEMGRREYERGRREMLEQEWNRKRGFFDLQPPTMTLQGAHGA
jgi:hypothetical protein